MAQLFTQVPKALASTLTRLSAIIILLASSAAWAASDTPWYQVELFIFSQNQDNLREEAWDDRLVPQPNKRAISLFGNRASKAGFRLLNSSSRKLPVSKSVMTRRGYQPLFHQVWQQPLLSKKHALPIKIRGGEQLNDQVFQLEGDITLDIARYLHLRTNLFYSLSKPADWPTEPIISEPAVEDSLITESDLEQSQRSNDIQPGNLNPQLNEIIKDPGLITARMKQGRRMRRDQLHYLDHPLFGLFIKLTRIESPSAALSNQPSTTGALTNNEKEITTTTSLAEEQSNPAINLPIPVTSDSTALTSNAIQ